MKLSRKKIIITVVISILLVLVLLILPRIYNIINMADEKKILFVMSINEVPETNKAICVDNDGNIYLSFSEEKMVTEITSGSIYKEKIVGQVSKIKLYYYYDKFCQLDEDMYFEGRNEGGHEFEPYFFYYGVKYNEEGPELIKLGDTTYYADDPDAEDIVQWMKKWNY